MKIVVNENLVKIRRLTEKLNSQSVSNDNEYKDIVNIVNLKYGETLNNLYFDKTNKFKKYTYPNSITRKRNQKELIDMLGIESYITEYECLFPRTKEYDESLKLYSHAVI